MSVVRFVILLTSLYLFLGCESKSRKDAVSSPVSNDLVGLNKRKLAGVDRKFSEVGSGINFHSESSSIQNVNSSWSTEEVAAEIESSFTRILSSVDDSEELISNDFRGTELVPSSLNKILSKFNEISLWEGSDEELRDGRLREVGLQREGDRSAPPERPCWSP